jgi:CheY-like chemotaxis protein
MAYRSLLVSTDDASFETLGPVLLGFNLAIERCGYAEALGRLTDQNYDAAVIDFADPHSAARVLEHSRQASATGATITVALLEDRTKVRNVFGAGANFILYLPFSREQAQAVFRAAEALIKRERRRSFRVPLQIPLELRVGNGPQFEGILLDLSEDGMDLVAPQPICPTTEIAARFSLPERGEAMIEVRAVVVWANPNGQSGVRFVELKEDLRQTVKAWIETHSQELLPDEPEPVSHCRLSDLSLGGCYVETESPFPEGSLVVLSLGVADTKVQAEGIVRIVHPGFGMGIEFAAHTLEHRSQVESFIGLLSSRPGITPELTVSPRALAAPQPSEDAAASDERVDPLLELLRSPGELAQEQFLEQLLRQRSSEVATV